MGISASGAIAGSPARPSCLRGFMMRCLHQSNASMSLRSAHSMEQERQVSDTRGRLPAVLAAGGLGATLLVEADLPRRSSERRRRGRRGERGPGGRSGARAGIGGASALDANGVQRGCPAASSRRPAPPPSSTAAESPRTAPPSTRQRPSRSPRGEPGSAPDRRSARPVAGRRPRSVGHRACWTVVGGGASLMTGMATKERPNPRPAAPGGPGVKPLPQTIFISEKKGAEPAPPPRSPLLSLAPPRN